MRFLKMLYSLLVILVINVLKLWRALDTNMTLLMRKFQMSLKLIDIIKELPTEITGRVIKNEITILGKFTTFNVSLILVFSVEYLLWLNAFAMCQTNVTIQSFMLNVQMFFQLVQTVKDIVALIKCTVVIGLIFYLLGDFLVGVEIVGVFLLLW